MSQKIVDPTDSKLGPDGGHVWTWTVIDHARSYGVTCALEPGGSSPKRDELLRRLPRPRYRACAYHHSASSSLRRELPDPKHLTITPP